MQENNQEFEMKKMFQTIIDKDTGNCTQAVIASLFELPLEKVPNFISFKDKWFDMLWKFINDRGYEFEGSLCNTKFPVGNEYSDRPSNIPTLKEMSGVDGFFYASVLSPKYYKRDDNFNSHAVIVDQNCKIVHDPNPEYAAIKSYPEADIIGYDGVINVYVINPIAKSEEIK